MFDVFINVFIFSFVVLLFLRIYCRLTVGRCYSQQDLTGKTVLITGASAGIGKFTALDLARRNARVLLACRNLEKAEKVKSDILSATGNKNVEVKHLNLESFDSVRKCAEDVLRTENRLDVLINNAGIIETEHLITEDGCEKNMQVNHLGHFLLTLLLLDLLKKSAPSRIINVSSLVYLFAIFNLEDFYRFKKSLVLRHYGNYYHRSKLANILFTRELSRRLDGTGVTVNALHPGVILSDFVFLSNHPVLLIFRFLTFILGKSVEEGAQTSIYLAVQPELQKISGKFFYDCRERVLFGQSRDMVVARTFFETTEKIVREKYSD